MSKKHLEKGFTLIELLVVIAIIALLSSVILSALSSARLKSEDALLIAEVKQYSTLMEQNYDDYGNYDNLIPYALAGHPYPDWFSTAGNCTDGSKPLSGTYAAQAEAICTEILNNTLPNAGYDWIGHGHDELWVFNSNGSTPHSQVYSLSVYLPYANEYYCLGSSGRSSFTKPSNSTPPYGYTNSGYYDDDGFYHPGSISFFSAPGCAYNP